MTETVKPDYVVVSFSGGKDSTAMLLHMIELDVFMEGENENAVS